MEVHLHTRKSHWNNSACWRDLPFCLIKLEIKCQHFLADLCVITYRNQWAIDYRFIISAQWLIRSKKYTLQLHFLAHMVTVHCLFNGVFLCLYIFWYTVKGIVQPKMDILSSFSYPQVVSNVHDFFLSVERKI